MLTLKCIDEKIKKLENEAKAIILKALHGEHSWQKARNLEKTILNEIKRLKTEKLKKIKGAEDFVNFVLENDLYNHFAVRRIRDDQIVQAIKLFLKVPRKHRKFVLEMAYLEAKWTPKDEDDAERFEEWLRRVYKPLKALTNQPNVDLPPHEKAKLLDELLKRARIDVLTFKKLLENDRVELRVSPFAEFDELDEDDKIWEWLKGFRKCRTS